MASWERDTGELDMPDPHAGDENAWEEYLERTRHGLTTDDVEYADEDEAGQLGLGVPGEQRAIPTLAAPCAENIDTGPEEAEDISYKMDEDPAQVRAMFKGFGWGVTE